MGKPADECASLRRTAEEIAMGFLIIFVMPVARHELRAPAVLRPWVVVRERDAGVAIPCLAPSMAPGSR
jgi:hypothetical protein